MVLGVLLATLDELPTAYQEVGATYMANVIIPFLEVLGQIFMLQIICYIKI